MEAAACGILKGRTRPRSHRGKAPGGYGGAPCPTRASWTDGQRLGIHRSHQRPPPTGGGTSTLAPRGHTTSISRRSTPRSARRPPSPREAARATLAGEGRRWIVPLRRGPPRISSPARSKAITAMDPPETPGAWTERSSPDDRGEHHARPASDCRGASPIGPPHRGDPDGADASAPHILPHSRRGSRPTTLVMLLSTSTYSRPTISTE